MEQPVQPTNGSGIPKHIPISVIIDHIDNKGLSITETAKLLGCSKSNVSERLQVAGITPGYLSKYKNHRADLLASLQVQFLNHLTPAKLQKASAYQLAGMYSLLFDKERLERGQSTENIAYADIVKAEQVAQQAVDRYIAKFGPDALPTTTTCSVSTGDNDTDEAK